MKKYIVGADPGFGETGLVLYLDGAEDNILAWATFQCPPKGQSDAARAASLADHVINELVTWIERFDIQHIDICIEVPFMGKNVASFQKQIRVVQEIESGILFRLAGEVKELWVTEIGPTQAKRLATYNGQASKQEVIEASPFNRRPESKADLSTLEAIADAWAIGLAAWEIMGGRFNFSSLKAVKVVRKNDED